MTGLGWPSEGMQVLAVGLVQLEFSGAQKCELLEQPTRGVDGCVVGCALLCTVSLLGRLAEMSGQPLSGDDHLLL